MTHDLYETSDLGVASALSCLGFRITALDRSNPRRIVFVFDCERSRLEDIVNSYWDGTLRLSPFAVLTHQKLLKQRMYSKQL